MPCVQAKIVRVYFAEERQGIEASHELLSISDKI